MNYDKSTDELLENAKKGILPTEENQIPSVSAYLSQLLNKYHTNALKVSEDIGMSKSQVYNFTSAKNSFVPSRNQLIAIMFVIGASLEETQNALNYAAHRTLYPRDPRDCILISHLDKGNRSKGLAAVETALSDRGFETLSKPLNDN